MNQLGFDSKTGRDDFLQLLVSQLQNQDPLEPVGQQDMLQQLAQFSMLEGVEQLNANFSQMLKLQELNEGANLVGRTVRYESGATGETQEGLVSEARVDGGQLIFVIDGEDVSLDQIEAVLNSAA
jgi:flagellar basal-body rod modification protein FlgD